MNVAVNLPAATVERLKERAAGMGQSLEAYLETLLGSKTSNGSPLAEDDILDTEYLAECAKEADPSITLESVHEVLSKIPGSMTQDFIAERDER
jgi:hypothetical protein